MRPRVRGYTIKISDSTKMMSFLAKSASAILLLVAASTSSVEGAELVVQTTFKPEGCDEGRKTKSGDHLFMHYRGTIDESSATGEAGLEFDSSHKRNRPFDFPLGAGRVIKGWDEGLQDMCVGEKRTLIIPPEKGYGDRGAGASIPGGATLRFEVECLNIQDSKGGAESGPPPNIFKEIDKDADGVINNDELLQFFVGRGMQKIPDGLWERNDANKDGIISWDEFEGPKGTKDPKKEL